MIRVVSISISLQSESCSPRQEVQIYLYTWWLPTTLSKLYSTSCVSLCYDVSLIFTLALTLLPRITNWYEYIILETFIIRCTLVIKRLIFCRDHLYTHALNKRVLYTIVVNPITKNEHNIIKRKILINIFHMISEILLKIVF